MAVHGVGALEQFNKMLKPDRAGDGESDRGPEGIPSAHPIPESEHVLRSIPKLPDFSFIGRDGHEMMFDPGLTLRG